MALRGWQPSLVALFAIVDMGSALNAPATSLHLPQGMHGGHYDALMKQCSNVSQELDGKGGSV